MSEGRVKVLDGWNAVLVGANKVMCLVRDEQGFLQIIKFLRKRANSVIFIEKTIGFHKNLMSLR